MKKHIVLFAIVFAALGATPAAASSPIDLISLIDSASLRQYAAPLVESYGVAMGSGWYNTAESHKFLGFDLGLRFMLIQVPVAARTFDAHVRYCYFDPAQNDTVWVDTVVTTATLFGTKGVQNDWIPSGAVGVPPGLPGGLGISSMPFVLPQASVGLPFGLQLTARYIPWPFSGTTVQFLGFGLKEELTALPVLSKSPVKVAVQGFYQKVAIGSALNSNTIGGNLQASVKLLMLTPYAGIGFDHTTMDINYTFNFKEPKLELGPPPRFYTEDKSVVVNYAYNSAVNWRTTIGVKANLGLAFVNVDYSHNLTSGYNAISAGTGIGLR